MDLAAYRARRGQLEAYFDRTAADAWARLTSDSPVGRIRAQVRAGRDEMRAQLLAYLPSDLTGRRLLDAGCGTGALAVEAARRGARVVAIDISPTLVGLARERAPADVADRIDFRVGDMLDESLGRFDHVVAMDSLIHYEAHEMVGMIARLAARSDGQVAFTFAPSTPLLAFARFVGRFFPRGDRAPALEPIRVGRLTRLLGEHPALAGWKLARGERIKRPFYISQVQELVRS